MPPAADVVAAAEIRMRAERRLGELIRAQKDTVRLATEGQPYQATGSKKEPVDRSPTLAEADRCVASNLYNRMNSACSASVK